jgi:hypothetical protein
MFYRIAASRLTLNLITLAILIGTAGIMTDQVRFLIDNYSLDFVPGSRSRARSPFWSPPTAFSWNGSAGSPNAPAPPLARPPNGSTDRPTMPATP